MVDSRIRQKFGMLPACCVSVWVVLGSIAALLLGQYQASVLHPAFVPFLLLGAVSGGLVITIVIIVVARLIRGQQRWNTVLWFMVAAIPVGLFSIPLIYAQQQWAKRMVPVGIRGQFAVMFGGSLMEAQAAWMYPKRIESDRLVMFYRELDEPDADIEAMDRHVAELEQTLGNPLRSKIHWIRGSLLGRSRLSFLGLALGSEKSPAGNLDRHEIAHAVLTQVRVPSADPPMMLHEGWAESQSGMSTGTLAAKALEAKVQDSTIGVVDLLSAENYRRDAGRAYSYGGAFVDFLLREFSVDQFVKIYNECNANTSDEDFRAVYGLSISELEDAFWRDAEAAAGEHR